MNNPANALGDAMWKFLMDGSQEADISNLKELVYTLIKMTTQKTAGQRREPKGDINWEHLEMLKWQIICEATALVLSGKLDELKKEESDNGSDKEKDNNVLQ